MNFERLKGFDVAEWLEHPTTERLLGKLRTAKKDAQARLLGAARCSTDPRVTALAGEMDAIAKVMDALQGEPERDE